MPQKKIIGDINGIKIIDELKNIVKEFPTLRFGTIIQGATDIKRRKTNFNLNDISSKEMLQAIKEFTERFRAKVKAKKG